jgi:hypothetical protein
VPDGVRVAALELDDLEQHRLERVENASVELGPASRVMMVAKTPSLNAANRLCRGAPRVGQPPRSCHSQIQHHIIAWL